MKKKLTLIMVTIILLALVSFIVLFFTSTNGVKNGEAKAIEKAKSEAELAEVTQVDWFHYEENYYVVTGTNQDDEKVIVWVPEDQKKQMVVKKAKDGLSEKEVVNLLSSGLEDFSNDKRPQDIIRIKLGMVEDAPAYEITYHDVKNRYSIIYIDFYDGEWYRVYNL